MLYWTIFDGKHCFCWPLISPWSIINWVLYRILTANTISKLCIIFLLCTLFFYSFLGTDLIYFLCFIETRIFWISFWNVTEINWINFNYIMKMKLNTQRAIGNDSFWEILSLCKAIIINYIIQNIESIPVTQLNILRKSLIGLIYTFNSKLGSLPLENYLKLVIDIIYGLLNYYIIFS